VAHPWHDIPLDVNADAIPAVIEIPQGTRNKYELDQATGLLRVDRVLYSAVHYPANYGFVPRTLDEDGDPLDVLVLGLDVVPLAWLTVRVLGALLFRDEHGGDTKLICVPLRDPNFEEYHALDDLPKHVMRQIRRFFEDYKALEDKPVEVGAEVGTDEARRILRECADRYNAKFPSR
jgi:inorganic pyrophosphatase